jgi:hypothetical protein
MIYGVAQGHSKVQHDAGIAIAIGDARGAPIPHERCVRKIPHGAHGLVPGVTAPHVEIPIHVETLVSSVALEPLRNPIKVTLHIRNRRTWIIYRKHASQIVDRFEGGFKF